MNFMAIVKKIADVVRNCWPAIAIVGGFYAYWHTQRPAIEVRVAEPVQWSTKDDAVRFQIPISLENRGTSEAREIRILHAFFLYPPELADKAVTSDVAELSANGGKATIVVPKYVTFKRMSETTNFLHYMTVFLVVQWKSDNLIHAGQYFHRAAILQIPFTMGPSAAEQVRGRSFWAMFHSSEASMRRAFSDLVGTLTLNDVYDRERDEWSEREPQKRGPTAAVQKFEPPELARGWKRTWDVVSYILVFLAAGVMIQFRAEWVHQATNWVIRRGWYRTFEIERLTVTENGKSKGKEFSLSIEMVLRNRLGVASVVCDPVLLVEGKEYALRGIDGGISAYGRSKLHTQRDGIAWPSVIPVEVRVRVSDSVGGVTDSPPYLVPLT